MSAAEHGEERQRGWFVLHPATRPDVLRAARLARENSGQPQFIHDHPKGRRCTEACASVEEFGSTVGVDRG